MTAPHPHRPAASRRTRAGGDLRVVRAAVFAAVCVVLAGAGHALASCATVPLWSLGVGFAGTFCVAAALAGRQRSLPGIAALLAVGQTVLHILFGLNQHGTTTAARSTETMDAALVERAARFVCGTTAAALSPDKARRILIDAGVGGTHVTHDPADAMTTAPGSTAALLPSLPMLLGHVLAAVAAGWVLRHGDLALLRLTRLAAQEPLVRSLRGALALTLALRAGLPGAPEAGTRAPRTTYAAPTALRTTALQHTLVRRGPPAAAPSFALAA
ncbi:hypothetical protein [Streptomyces caniscabiei]|uniref:Integral membrane protein n=1 Tax=Streptomyces caniscabiei TaxID=2746961 RepID=A0A927L477_9ACTN|nr:hypothetical protein [Streptomyces caniscabiei]MBD9724728.1 hypothetical protein [Streptomyces caniscabiei]MDX3508142.1 hypothetical protein [Streptomyces caniscabiei]MDX3718104.1 hypothetical protein [Streptomyces caniscabiei]WEO25818.1 hypothetical protein IHE65_22975 [Streptomyces caniscabiei]